MKFSILRLPTQRVLKQEHKVTGETEVHEVASLFTRVPRGKGRTACSLTSVVAMSVNIVIALSMAVLAREDAINTFASITLYLSSESWSLGWISFRRRSAVNKAMVSASCFSTTEDGLLSLSAERKVSVPEGRESEEGGREGGVKKRGEREGGGRKRWRREGVTSTHIQRAYSNTAFV